MTYPDRARENLVLDHLKQQNEVVNLMDAAWHALFHCVDSIERGGDEYRQKAAADADEVMERLAVLLENNES